jgi:plastocyanin
VTTRLLLLALALLLAGCGSDDSDEAGADGGGTQVGLRDFSLEPPNLEVDGGTLTLTVVNDGQTAHALEIEGQGVEEETPLLEPGESAELTVELEKGEYEMYCPVGNHRAQGMAGTVLVDSGGGGASTDDGGDDDDDRGGYYP